MSLSAVLQKADNVMPCYTMVKHQLKPQVVEEPRSGAGAGEFTHSVSWTWAGKEISLQGAGNSKRAARNAAARDLLLRLSVEESEIMDPAKNGTLAQWAIEWLNERLQATMELQEESAAVEDSERGGLSHTQICTWSCPQVDGETVVRSSAGTVVESRRQAMAELYRQLPPEVERVVGQPGDGASGDIPRSPPTDDADAGRLVMMHNAVMQKLGVMTKFELSRLPSGEFECVLRWQFYDEAEQAQRSLETRAAARNKQLAKAAASEQMLVKRGHLPQRSEEFKGTVVQIKQALAGDRVGDAVSMAHGLLETSAAEPLSWAFFLPEVLQAALAEGDQGAVTSLLSSALERCRGSGGMPPFLWESLLDEASFAMRHYHCAQTALEMLAHAPLTTSSLPSEAEASYFGRFRHLMALERHGGLLHGIQEYEVDEEVAASIPVVEVHRREANKVVLTSTPVLGALNLVEGAARPLKDSDIVLLVPNEALQDSQAAAPVEDPFGELPPQRTTNWQHPEAWLANITSVKGNPRNGEELQIFVRRISRFGSDALRSEDGSPPTLPITLGRQYSLFLIAMETPTARALAAVRCLTKVQLPAWSDDYEGRKASYYYNEDMRRVLMASPEESRAGALEQPRTALGEADAVATLNRLVERNEWCRSLTPSQSQAVQKAMVQRLSLIQGPPGTGKTFVACAIVAAWLQRCMPGERILVVADSNVAVDNLHSRMMQFGIQSVRVGVGKEANTLVGDQLWQQVRSAQVIVATCIGSGMEVLNSKGDAGWFQRVVIDECTQACEPAALVALGRGCEQAVLVGDHAQLPATVLSKLAKRDGLGVSLFERMVSSNGLEPTLLNEQRRMHSSIAEFPNQAFYASQLVNAVEDSALAPVPGFRWPNQDSRVCFVDVASHDTEGKRGFSTFNATEADAIADAVCGFVNAGVEPHEFCVLTPYQAQRAEIARALRDRGFGHLLGVLSVDTVDGYQGMERDLVLFSATRSNSNRSLGFLADPRRMNVMLTRARRGLVVFGHGDTLRQSQAEGSHWASWLDWVEGRGAAVSHASLQGGGAAATPQVDAFASGAPDVSLQDTRPQPDSGFGGLPPPPPPPMTSTWEKVWSEEHQRHYFWDTATNAVQWESPPGLSA